MKPFQILNKAVFVLSILWIIMPNTSCNKEEDYNAKTYYDVVGVGYVFDGDSARPIPNVPIEIAIGLEGGGDFIGVSAYEEYITDVKGRYQVRFIKRTHKRDAKKYTFDVQFYFPHPYSTTTKGENPRDFSISVEKVKNTQSVLDLDTIKFYRAN